MSPTGRTQLRLRRAVRPSQNVFSSRSFRPDSPGPSANLARMPDDPFSPAAAELAFPSGCLPAPSCFSSIAPGPRDPRHISEAWNSELGNAWRESTDREMASWDTRQVKRTVSRTPDMPIIKGKWVFKTKYLGDLVTVDKLKSRYVARGDTQQIDIDFEETFAPTLQVTTLRTLLQLAATYKLHLRHFDISTAYLYADLDEIVYLEPAPGYATYDANGVMHAWALDKAVYGLRQSARAWNKCLHDHLISLGFVQSAHDPCLYTRGSHETGDFIALATYVDDLGAAGSDTATVDALLVELRAFFKVEDKGPLNWFLSITIDRQGNDLFANQTAYARDMLRRFGLDKANPASTPIPQGFVFLAHTGEPSADHRLFRELLGALRWLTLTRIDICFAVNALCRYMANPSDAHVSAAKHVCRYVLGTLDTGLWYRHNNGTLLMEAYSDADLAGDLTQYKSTAGYLIRLNPTSAPVSFASKIQHDIATSTCHAEYIALYETSREIVHMRGVLEALLPAAHLPLPPTLTYGDNEGSIALCKNPIHSKRNKHFPIKLHYTRQLRTDGVIDVLKVHTSAMWADSLTKPFAPKLLRAHTAILTGSPTGTPAAHLGALQLAETWSPANSDKESAGPRCTCRKSSIT